MCVCERECVCARVSVLVFCVYLCVCGCPVCLHMCLHVYFAFVCVSVNVCILGEIRVL